MTSLVARDLSKEIESKLIQNISFLMEIGKLGVSRNSQKTVEAMIDVLFKIQNNPELRKQVKDLLQK